MIDLGDPDVLYLEPRDLFDPAIVGLGRRADGSSFVVYDSEKCIEQLAKDFHDENDQDQDAWSEAAEYFSFNTAGAWVGPHTPAFIERPTE